MFVFLQSVDDQSKWNIWSKTCTNTSTVW